MLLYMERMPVTLKGTPQGIRLRPLVESWPEVMRALEFSLEDGGDFFRGGRVILDLGARGLTDEEFRTLRQLLDQYDMELWAILSENATATRTARAYGLRTRLPGKVAKSQKPADPDYNGLFLQRTLRSGQRIQSPGHVILLGDVNPGAEVIAGGNIIIWGRARGLVHAGALGDETCVVCALELMPSQLRIAGRISRAPEDQESRPQPEMAKISNDTIVAIPWTLRG